MCPSRKGRGRRGLLGRGLEESAELDSENSLCCTRNDPRTVRRLNVRGRRREWPNQRIHGVAGGMGLLSPCKNSDA